MRVVVVGSGLAAVGAIRALLKSGHRPTVLDVGAKLPQHLAEHRVQMAQRSPTEWTGAEWKRLGRNDGVPGRVVPRKLVFGSDYFYSTEQADLTRMDEYFEGTPPWSPARGGFSAGWGAAVLPPAPTDVAEWPVTHDELLRNMHEVLVDIPVSEPDDEIGRVFGRLRPKGGDLLKLSEGQANLMKRLQRASRTEADATVLVGQSRLLTQAGLTATNRCRFCGHCSSGCVYGSIHTAEHDVERWIRESRIDYHGDVTVFEVHEQAGSVHVRYRLDDRTESLEADRLFLAAGAVNSARILLNSSIMVGDTAVIRRTGGALHLFASAGSHSIDWPVVNTQTSHFIEMLIPSISPAWAHTQVSQPNELVLRRLGLTHANQKGLSRRMMMLAARHLILAALNVHSSHGPTYEICVVRRQDSLPALRTRQRWSAVNRETVRSYSTFLSKSLRSANLYQIPLTRQDSVAAHGYHFGASFPMCEIPQKPLDTDVLGRPFGWQRVHVVDASVLPAIPATTVGLLTMANAHRIAARAVSSDNSV